MDGGTNYVIGLTFATLMVLITLSYASYKYCNRSMHSQSTSTPDTNNNPQFRNVFRGVDDNILKMFPAFIYSEDMTLHKGSGCSICLADYKAEDVIRLLPKCSHLFHRECIDTWLKVHTSCPVCRISPLPVKISIQS
ncbi:zinc finger, RING/FYVE/PHD-type [Artemisia annua]|uniref:RING-type E3 ubiquitin transferase n=1 Tax=Artemisia annua TaxID=35608 RepID=A0A2U1MF75_ARTAN|nr:zinc finger, RING/FYVE/PHD-type [Artemisia annua]